MSEEPLYPFPWRIESHGFERHNDVEIDFVRVVAANGLIVAVTKGRTKSEAEASAAVVIAAGAAQARRLSS